MPYPLSIEDITEEDLLSLDGNRAWRFFLSDLEIKKEALHQTISQPTQTTCLEDVRLIQGHIQNIEENLAWISVTKQELEISKEEKQTTD